MSANPARDPQPGDTMERGSFVRRCTGRHMGGRIVLFHWWHRLKPDKPMAGRTKLTCWQRWAASAVIK